MLWSEDMLRPPDSRVDLVTEQMALVREPTFVRPSYRSIGMLGGCQSPPNNLPRSDPKIRLRKGIGEYVWERTEVPHQWRGNFLRLNWGACHKQSS